MKTSVTKIMMSFALMGCLIFSASDASAQGRSRSQGGSTSSRSQSAAVSRSNSSTAPTVSRNNSSSVSRSSATPQVSRSNSSSSVSRSSATPQVSRSNSNTSRSSATPQVSRSSSSSSTSRSATTPQVSRSSSSTSHSSATPQVSRSSSSTSRTIDNGNRVSSNVTTRGGNDKAITSTRHNENLDKGSKSDRVTTNSGNTSKPSGTPKPNHDNRDGKMDKPNGGDRDHNGGTMSNDRNGNKSHDRNGNKGHDRNGNNRPDNKGQKDRHGNKGDNARHGDNGKHGGHHGYSPNNRYEYNDHHYRNEFASNYRNHNWSRPLPPPARVHRPAPLVWYRPTIPVGWHPYAGAPVIDRILGIMFGTLYDASLDFLYNSGYYIDGYADGIIYLRDVPMLNLYWSDVMLNYDYNRLVNAQFVYHSSYYNTSRFNRVYNSLTRLYGPPVYRDGMTISWYGGNNTGWVTLTMNESYGDYYTIMSIGY